MSVAVAVATSRELQAGLSWAEAACEGRGIPQISEVSDRIFILLALFREITFAATMGRAMAYPYTIGAMLKAFPLKYHIDKSWIFKVMLQNAMNSNTNYFSMV